MAGLNGRWLVAGLPVVVGAMLASGCGGGSGGDASGATITVFAAASLSDVMTELADAFERERNGATVELNSGASSSLREQILAGAPADVFATADAADLEALDDGGEIADSGILARTGMQIAVPRGNPGEVTGLDDFARAELFLGLCAAEVPCGEYARQVLAGAGVEPSLDTEATDVRALLTQIASGDLDAGLVYATDVRSAGGDVEGIDLPAGVDVDVVYAIGTMARAEDRGDAGAFYRFVRSETGASILESHGFDARGAVAP